MTIKALYPTVRPTLNLDFAKTKALDPRVTFTRASTATFVGADGLIKTAGNNVPRFDHNPATEESLGLLVEDPRTNLLLRSEEFNNASWGTLSVTVSANTQIAPDGTTSADTLTDVNGVTSANVGCFQTTTLADSTTYAMSCYVKAGTKTTCRIGIRNKAGVNIFANFNLATASTTVGNAVSSTIQDAGNGWYRCTAICASLTGATGPRGLVYMDTGSYTANGTGTIHVWGAQLEEGTFATSYILNVNTPLGVTRSADVANLPTTGWMDTTGGTILTEYYRLPLTSFFGAALWSLGAGNPVLGYTNGGLQNGLDFTSGGQGYMSFPVLAGKNRAAFKFQNVGQWSTTQNGATPQSNIVSETWSSSPTSLDLGYGAAVPFGGWRANAPIARLAYYPPLLPNAQLQALTAT